MASALKPVQFELEKNKHISYWLRCLKALLPTEYTSGDSNRMFLAYLVLSALDLLDVLQACTQVEERRQFKEWIYRSQHPNGGFCGSPMMLEGQSKQDTAGVSWDYATLPSTYFALVLLGILGDDLKEVRKPECLNWLYNLQREDGSFGEMLEGDGQVGGRRDVRYCYWAAGVRWVLRGQSRPRKECVLSDIDVDAVVKYINSSQVRLSTSPLSSA